MAVGKIMSLSTIESAIRTSGTFTAEFNCIGSQVDGSRVFVMLSLPFPFDNNQFSISVSSCVLIGVASIPVSSVTIDNKTKTGLRIAIAYSGTVGRSYAVTITATISR